MEILGEGAGGGGGGGKGFFFSHVGATLCCRVRRGQLRRAALSLVYNMFC